MTRRLPRWGSFPICKARDGEGERCACAFGCVARARATFLEICFRRRGLISQKNPEILIWAKAKAAAAAVVVVVATVAAAVAGGGGRRRAERGAAEGGPLPFDGANACCKAYMCSQSTGGCVCIVWSPQRASPLSCIPLVNVALTAQGRKGFAPARDRLTDSQGPPLRAPSFSDGAPVGHGRGTG
eukprot:6535468-Prymnesium_polylepis.1